MKTISIDFDRVIHKYSWGWKDGSIYDKPVEGAIRSLIKLSKVFNIVISSSRVKTKKDINMIKKWMLYSGFPEKLVKKVEITNKKPPAIAYIDDRAIRFTNWNDIENYFCFSEDGEK